MNEICCFYYFRNQFGAGGDLGGMTAGPPGASTASDTATGVPNNPSWEIARKALEKISGGKDSSGSGGGSSDSGSSGQTTQKGTGSGSGGTDMNMMQGSVAALTS